MVVACMLWRYWDLKDLNDHGFALVSWCHGLSLLTSRIERIHVLVARIIGIQEVAGCLGFPAF